MTRKHFEAIAAITASISNDETRAFVARQQASYFAGINPNFDRARYLTACNVS
jgi:hypothetical protein